MPSTDTSADLLVASLCAEWCSSCRSYRPVFDAQSRLLQGQAAFAWVDIEDHDGVIGEIDIDNFPTLLIARGSDVLFLGPVMPHAETLARLVQSAAQGDLSPLRDPSLADLPQRVRSLL